MTEQEKVNNLTAFLEALEEWGVEKHRSMAEAILDFQASGYDLSEYEIKE